MKVFLFVLSIILGLAPALKMACFIDATQQSKCCRDIKSVVLSCIAVFNPLWRVHRIKLVLTSHQASVHVHLIISTMFFAIVVLGKQHVLPIYSKRSFTNNQLGRDTHTLHRVLMFRLHDTHFHHLSRLPKYSTYVHVLYAPSPNFKTKYLYCIWRVL